MENTRTVELFMLGGIFMWPLLLCSIAGLALSMERFFSLRRARLDAREFMDMVRQILHQGRVQDALDLCDETDTPIARVLRAGLLRHPHGKADVRAALEDAAHLEIPRLERHLSGLATTVNIAPLLGVLGTVHGLINAFAKIGANRGQVNPSDLASGIGNALIATAAGLMIAIPLMVVYNYLVSQVDNIIVDMEVGASEMMDLLEHHKPARED